MKKFDYNNYSFDGHPVRITLHWTGGAYTPSSLDAEHYQFLIAEEDGKAVTYCGKYTVADQDSTSSDYAAHTKGFNSKNIGISLCGMAGSQENGTFGKYPLTAEQVDEAVELCAFLCEGYDIKPTEQYLASHCEIQRIHGVQQSGKWDISCLEYSPLKWQELNDDIRNQVADRIAHGGSKPSTEKPVVHLSVPRGTAVIVNEV